MSGCQCAGAHPTHARTGGRAGGRTARARRARMGRRGAAVFGCSLRAHHSPDSASSSTREPAPRQRPPERMRDRDFEREPDEPGVCGLDGSGRAGERSGVRQLMGCRCAVVCCCETCAPGVCRSVRCRARGKGVNARSPSADGPGATFSSCACGRACCPLIHSLRGPFLLTFCLPVSRPHCRIIPCATMYAPL